MSLVGAVLGAIVLLASTGDDLALGATWAKKRVGVYDYSSDAWRPIVEATVAEFNAILPARVPQLVYQAMGEAPCSQISTQLHRAGITVCTVPSLVSADELGLTRFSVKQGRLAKVRISLSEASSPRVRDTTVCHEFMHATTGIPDHYAARPTTSCVWRNLSAPGAFDAHYARKVSKQRDTDKKHGRKTHGAKH